MNAAQERSVKNLQELYTVAVGVALATAIARIVDTGAGQFPFRAGALPVFFALLVILVPFTINGLAVRESFFVSFLGQLGVGADPAFASGFLFFLVTVMLALPGAVILTWEGVRPAAMRARDA